MNIISGGLYFKLKKCLKQWLIWTVRRRFILLLPLSVVGCCYYMGGSYCFLIFVSFNHFLGMEIGAWRKPKNYGFQHHAAD